MLQAGPFPEVERIFTDAVYSREREDAARNLALSPEFGSTVAIECLWDCEAAIRLLGCQHADSTAPGVRERLAQIAADTHEDADVVAAAQRRCGD